MIQFAFSLCSLHTANVEFCVACCELTRLLKADRKVKIVYSLICTFLGAFDLQILDKHLTLRDHKNISDHLKR